MKRNFNTVNGLLAGGATVAYLLCFYLISARLMLNPVVYWGSTVIFVYFMARSVRRVKEGPAPAQQQTLLREALRAAFAVFIIGNGIYYLFYFLMFKYIDPQLIAIQREIFMSNTAWLGKGNTQNLEQQFGPDDFKVTFSNTLFQYVFSLMGGFVLALILSGLMTRRR